MKGDFECPYYQHSQMECLKIPVKARYELPTATTGDQRLVYLRANVGCMGNVRKCEAAK